MQNLFLSGKRINYSLLIIDRYFRINFSIFVFVTKLLINNIKKEMFNMQRVKKIVRVKNG